jgi:heme/copper-type cytochrome/quinol oxidase subunit 2
VRAWAACLALAGLAWAGPSEPGIQVRVSRQGFEPAVIRLHKGEPARLLLQSSDEEHCFALDEFRIEKRVRPGKLTRLEFTPDRAGSFDFYSCLEPDSTTLRGKLVVTE